MGDNRDESAKAGSLDADDPPAVIHFAEGKFPLQLAGADQVVGEAAQTLCLLEV